MTALMILMMLAQTAAAPAVPPVAGPTGAPAEGLPIAPLPEQTLPRTGCAAYLFAPGAKPVFLALASADPAQLRVSIGGTDRKSVV